jgi:uncharacterized membrane protein YfcA
MDLSAALLLAAAGFAGGVVTAVVGGSSLICFPAMLAAGLPPIVASASNTVAVTPASLVAAFSDTGRTPAWTIELVWLTVIALAGSALGAVLLIASPEAVFASLIPVLIGAATLLFALGPRVQRWLARRAASRPQGGHPLLQPLLFAPITVYGGYFGAGMGVMTLAVLAIGTPGDYRTINALKNLLAVLTNVVAIVIYIVYGVVAWPATVAMMAGAVGGGFLGARFLRFVPDSLIRAIIVIAGTMLTLIYAWRYWS